jgi:hypothetical protein
MKIGVVFPQTEIGEDPAAIRDYAQAVEALGYTHILAFDSVVGANPDRPGGWDSQYTYQHAFHEPFVLFAFCAAVTRRIELVTGVLILPQRQTTLVAKQADGGTGYPTPASGPCPSSGRSPSGWEARARRSSAAPPASPTAGSRCRPSAPAPRRSRRSTGSTPSSGPRAAIPPCSASRGAWPYHVRTLERFKTDTLG